MSPTQPGLAIKQTGQVQQNQPLRFEVQQLQTGRQTLSAAPSLQTGQGRAAGNVTPNRQQAWGKGEGGWGGWGNRRINQTDGNTLRAAGVTATPRTDVNHVANVPHGGMGPGQINRLGANQIANVPRGPGPTGVLRPSGTDRTAKTETTGSVDKTASLSKTERSGQINPPARPVDTHAVQDQRERLQRLERVERVSPPGKRGRRGGAP